ncbi:DUF4407 domain-containing protein [Marichromatium bheemlicum]|uniref:DUF4407 domain-containing protein n=1 Tax=Marichromatium bheemlicum TaxID=365339 RepID=A0ABX1IA98_9GAMM|nr:DUF4407 domain-containing protein [Marichromatium bheemlicum]NKN33280.1 hypothetical protein [Marichromatium bheemlicum]
MANGWSRPGPGRLLLDRLRLRPYGAALLTPAVRTWLGFATLLILLMALLEGVVWGLVGASLVPEASPWLRWPAGGLFFLLMFTVIWVVDASLMLSERPRGGLGGRLRWFVGVLVRILIVALSLYVTAPLLARLIRADDIALHHQRQVERYHVERAARLEARLAERLAPLTRETGARIAALESERARLTETLERVRARRARIEAAAAPGLELLREELAAARLRLGDELHGRAGRPPGYGPEARRWERQVGEQEAELERAEAALGARLGGVDAERADIEQRLRALAVRLDALRASGEAERERLRAELVAAQPPAEPPRLTFAARSKALEALRARSDERGVPHFETVEGFTQALLAILFCALLALKLFEPGAVRAYFDDRLQGQYRKYLRGGLAAIPGFEHWQDPARRLSPHEFAAAWHAHEHDPAAFHAQRLAMLEAAAPVESAAREQRLAAALEQARYHNLAEEQGLARERRARELAAQTRELELRHQALAQALREDLAQRRAQREVEWGLDQDRERETLRQRRARFDAELHQLGEEQRWRERESEILHQQRMQALELESQDQRRIRAVARQRERAEACQVRAERQLERLQTQELAERERLATARARVVGVEGALEQTRAQLATLPSGSRRARRLGERVQALVVELSTARSGVDAAALAHTNLLTRIGLIEEGLGQWLFTGASPEEGAPEDESSEA